MRSNVAVIFPTPGSGSTLSFHKAGASYQIIADWNEHPGISGEAFTARLLQRYGYHASKAKLQEQGYDVRTEEDRDGTIRLVVSRLVLRDRAIETHEVECGINLKGEVTLSVSGTPGTMCLEATRGLEAALGDEFVERVMVGRLAGGEQLGSIPNDRATCTLRSKRAMVRPDAVGAVQGAFKTPVPGKPLFVGGVGRSLPAGKRAG